MVYLVKNSLSLIHYWKLFLTFFRDMVETLTSSGFTGYQILKLILSTTFVLSSSKSTLFICLCFFFQGIWDLWRTIFVSRLNVKFEFKIWQPLFWECLWVSTVPGWRYVFLLHVLQSNTSMTVNCGWPSFHIAYKKELIAS